MFTHKAGAVLAERGLNVSGLSKSMNETHLAVKQRAGFHKVVYHLVSADLSVSVRREAKRGELRSKQDGSVCKLVQSVNCFYRFYGSE